MAGRVDFEDRMSANDALMWEVETDPHLRSTICGIQLLDRPPHPERFARTLERCVREIPRLRQRAVSDPLGLAPPAWEPDPAFDLGFHVRKLRSPGEGSLRDLFDLAQPIAMQAFDRDRPLWELYIVEGLERGRAAVIMKLHHAVSDGVGLVKMTKGLIERGPEPSPREREPLPELQTEAAPSELERIRRAFAHRTQTRLEDARRAAGALGAGIGSVLRDPSGAGRTFSDTAASVGRMLAPVSEPLSPILRGRSLSAHFDVVFLPLDEMKRAARAVDGTVNDVFVGAVTGGLRHYHEHFGAPVAELRMNMPINVREGEKGQKAGNQFAPVRFAVPVDVADPSERMRQIHELVAAQRAEPSLAIMDDIAGVLAALPGSGPARLAGSMMKAIDFTTSNVPGPRFPVYMSGAKVEASFGFGPLAGAAINVTCFSYDGEVAIAVNTDPAAVTDPALFAQCLRKGLDEVLATA